MDPVESDWYGPDMATFGDRLAAAREHAVATGHRGFRRYGWRASARRHSQW